MGIKRNVKELYHNDTVWVHKSRYEKLERDIFTFGSKLYDYVYHEDECALELSAGKVRCNCGLNKLMNEYRHLAGWYDSRGN